MSDALKQITQRWFQEVWNEGNLEAIDEMAAPGSFGHGVSPESGGTIGLDAFRGFVVQMRAAFPDLHIAIEELVAEGDLVCARCSVTGTHTGAGLMGLPPTGRSISISGMTMMRIESGRIIEGWNNYDFLGLFEQLELVCRPQAGS